ncbi:MAG TPA: SRPBCC domain-containing protein [Pseudolabrys sp.]|nr:SRPBCC domain-containing protein [Pseudolabrys sp.]
MPPAATSSTAPRELVVTRFFDAPRELVFKMWTDPAHARHWWGPRDYPVTQLSLDARPGGKWRGCLTSTQDGRALWQHGVFREVVPPARLVFTFVWEEEGERGTETVVTVTFTEENGKTRMVMWQTPFQSAPERDGHGFGWASTFNRLTQHLNDLARSIPMSAAAIRKPTATREVTITRVYDAPRSLVFKMWTDPQHMAQWWGPQGFTNPVCELDVRPGGRMYVVMHGPAGTDFDRDFPMSGTFHEIVAPERLVFTSVAEDDNGNPHLEAYTVVTFEDLGGKTRLTVSTKAIGISDAAPAMLGGMEAGWTQSLEKLAALPALRT